MKKNKGSLTWKDYFYEIIKALLICK